MNLYTLALGLALGEARADEPKECIDEVVINIAVQANDAFGLRILSPEGQKEISTKLKSKFESQLEIPTEVVFGNNIDGALTVKYTTREILKNDLYSIDLSSISPVILDFSQKRVKEYLELEHAFLLPHRIVGFADKEKQTVYVFDPWLGIREEELKWFTIYKEEEYQSFFTRNKIDEMFRDAKNSIDERFMGIVLHEIGHLFSLKHGGKENVMSAEINFYSSFTGNYSFSPEDKAKIRSQLCKPEENKKIK